MNRKDFILFFGILILAVFFRFYNLNWDSYLHLHPDERAIVMFTLPLSKPQSLSDFFSVQSSWNPHFFAYGSFPLYFLKTTSELLSTTILKINSYDGITLLGRFISAIFDIGTLIIVFSITKKLFSKTLALIASFCYTISVLPIQLSHFYAVDTPLTFFISATILALISFYEKPTIKKSIFIGIFFGFSLGTKISASVLIVSIGAALIADFFLLLLKNPHMPHVWLPHIPKAVKRLLLYGTIISASTIATFLIIEPYALIDFVTFQRQTLEQSHMTRDAFTFPYTLQYVGKIPYLYELKNIFFFGLGPILAIFSFIGSLLFSFHAFKKKRSENSSRESIIAVFFWTYFFIVGSFAIGFMRYMLPLYPFFAIFASLALYKFLVFLQHRFKHSLTLITYYLLLIALLIWPFSFLSIYSKPTTRLVATEWIQKNIPSGKTIAIEHWDDPLPMFGAEKYTIEYLELYNYESEEKWNKINNQLSRSDYIILASNRLYVPLQKLSNCTKYPGHCYPITAHYYQNLFADTSEFKKVVEFTSYPTIPILKIPIIDDFADESFTVYDHPKILIFKRK